MAGAMAGKVRGTVYDVAVVGGGVVGLAAALALRCAGRSVAVLERQPPTAHRGALGFDPRTLALSPASVDFLRRVGNVDDVPMNPIGTMRVWEHDGAAALHFDAAKPLAWVLENSALAARLWRHAAPRVDFVAPAAVTAFDEDDHTIALHHDASDAPVVARLVVAADGANSRVRALTAVPVRREPIAPGAGQHAIATIARLRAPHANTAWQRFNASGPVALLPLAEARTVAVIWSAAEPDSARLGALDDGAFAHALECAVEGIGGGIECVDKRFAVPVRQAMAANLNPMPRVVLAGDAARALHPLAGQGVNVGLEDAYAIANVARGRQPDLGAPGTWREYALRRRLRSKWMLTVMRGLLHAYCAERASKPWLRLARNTAVRCIDASPAAKAQLIREAMGQGPLACSAGAGARRMRNAASSLGGVPRYATRIGVWG